MSENIMESIIVNMLLTNHEWYASLLSRMHRIEDNSIPTLGTTFIKDVLTIKYNSKYLKSLTPLEQIAVVEHELHHVFLSFWDRLSARNMKIFNLSHDIAINQYIDNLPKDHLSYKSFPFNLPDQECAEVYYNIINKHTIKVNLIGGSVRVNNKYIGRTCERTGEEFTEIEKEILKNTVLTSSYTNTSYNIQELINKLKKQEKINWKSILRQYISGSVKSESRKSWKRYSRKLGELFKGKVKTIIPKIVVAIDTSGSIDTEQFKLFINEIECIQNNYNYPFYIIECDTIIQKEYKLQKFKEIDTNFKGRGGTNFVPLFDRCKEIKPNLLIFFTDTEGEFPTYKPKHKTLWVVTDKRHVRFGGVLTIPPEE